MADDRKPPGIPSLSGKSISERTRASSPSSDDRDYRVDKARPPSAPLFVDEEPSRNHDIETRKEIRRGRTTEVRLEKLEEFKDDIREKFDGLKDSMNDRLGEVEKAVATFGGQMTVVPQLIETMTKATDALQQKDHLRFTATLDVDKAKQLSEIEVHKVESITEAEVKKADGLTNAEVRKKKWDLAIKIAAILGALGTAIATVVAAGKC